MRFLPFFTTLTVFITLSVSQISFAQRPWNKWAAEEGLRFLPENTIDSLNSGVQRQSGEFSGEVGYVWIEYTHTLSVIHMQVINNDGEFLYPCNGCEVYVTERHIENVTLCPADDGNWFISYVYPNGDNWALFSSRIDQDGGFLWEDQDGGIMAADGRGICPQYTMTPDDDNGFILVYQEAPSNDRTQIIARHVLDDGRIDHDWEDVWVDVFGMSMENIEGEPRHGFSTIADSEGGVIVLASNQARHGNMDIFIQRISHEGDVSWNNGAAVCVCTNESVQSSPQVYADGAGGTFVLWVDSRGGGDNGDDLYAQRIDGDGNLMWNEEGEVICANELDQSRFAATLYEPGVLAVVWADTRTVWEMNFDYFMGSVYVNCITGDDALDRVWHLNPGRLVAEDCLNFGETAIAVNPAGEVTCAWTYESAFPAVSIMLQKLSDRGRLEWDAAKNCSGNRVCSKPSIFINQHREYLVDWLGWVPSGRCFQMVDDQGDLTPESDKIVIKLRNHTNNIESQSIHFIDDNDFLVTWYDPGVSQPCVNFGRNSGEQFEIVNSSIGYHTNSRSERHGNEYLTVPDASGGVMISDSRSIQKFSPDGHREWGENGISGSEENLGWITEIVADNSGGAYVFWECSVNHRNIIYYQRINAEGECLWDSGRRVFPQTLSQQFETAVLDNEGAVVVVCNLPENLVNHDKYLIAQRIDQDGEKLWGEEGILVCNAEADQENVNMVACEQGVFLVWMDWRNWRQDRRNPDIYGQVIDSEGNLLWEANGRYDAGIAFTEWYEVNHSLIIDNDNYAWLIWKYQPQEGDSYRFQKIDINGEQPELLFGAEGLSFVEGALIDRDDLVMIHDGRNGFWAVWTDLRDRPADIYGIHIDPEGDCYPPWAEAGLPICMAENDQHNPSVILAESSGEAGIIVSWIDCRDIFNSEYTIYCQRVADDFGNVADRSPSPDLPGDFRIISLYPNPFNNQTEISYYLPSADEVSVSVFDLQGRLLYNDTVQEGNPGTHSYVFEPDHLASGQYILRLGNTETSATQKFVYLK